ncbi:MAG: DUF4391 domain-containing protein [Anaerosomatales bacterium]|nr:DUF4391 domain-containing protein [Anaerosomatales bacterium]
MTPQELYDAFAFPNSCTLAKRVFKKLFLENGDLTAADKRALSDAVVSITWQYTLKPSTVPVQAYRDDEHEYDEIAVLEMELADRAAASRLAEVVHRTIPYPVLLVAAHEGGVQLSAAPKRLSRAEKNRIVASSFELTPWLDGHDRTPVEEEFVASLHIDGLPHAHFRALYEGWVQRMVALACTELSGIFDVAPGRSFVERRAALDACRALDREIRTLRAAVRSETSFARQVELNTEIKNLEARLRRDVAAL